MKQLGGAAHIDLQRLVGLRKRGEGRVAQVGRQVGDRLEREFVIGMGDDLAGGVDQETEAGRRRVNGLDVGDHGVHRHIAGDHALQAAVAQDGHGERDHQLAGAGTDVGRRHHRLAGLRGLLVPGARGRIVGGWNPARVGELVRLVGVADIHADEAARRGHRLEGRHRIGRQRRILQRDHHLGLGRHPVIDAGDMAACDGLQVLADRVVVVGAGDDVVEATGEGQCAHHDGDAGQQDAGTDGVEHGMGSCHVERTARSRISHAVRPMKTAHRAFS